MNATPTLVLTHAAQLIPITTSPADRLTGTAMRQIEIIPDGAIVVAGGQVAWLGPTQALPPLPPDVPKLDVAGRVVLPGFVDSHTHLLFAGSREQEFEDLLQGKTYQQIAAAGGGIAATVRAVRGASREELKRLARRRLDRLLAYGVTTVEVKSGYGLTLEDELKCLEVVADLDAEGPLELIPTFLGAHTVPAEYAADRAEYLRLLLEDMLPEVARCRLARFCDVFCETGVFSLEESAAILRRGRALGLEPKLHADELTPLGGAVLAAQLGAVSADHLLCITEEGIAALAGSSTVATLLPGTAFFLRMKYAPARRLIERGVTVALASDCNPGTCPTENLPLVGTLACVQMGLLPAEALVGLTLNAAAALGCGQRIGSLAVGRQADLVIYDVPDYRQLFYHFGTSHVWRVLKRGQVVFTAPASSGSSAI